MFGQFVDQIQNFILPAIILYAEEFESLRTKLIETKVIMSCNTQENMKENYAMMRKI